MNIPGNVWLMTRRTSERRMFLKPGPAVTATFIYVLGWACARFQIRILAAYVGSNHYHIVLYDPQGRASCFAERLNSKVARILNHRWRRVRAAFWDNQQLSLVQLIDVEAIIDAAAYGAANPTQDGLLDDPSKWPGVWLTARDLGRVIHAARPKTRYFTKRSIMPKSVTLELGLPPQLEHLGIEGYRELHDQALDAKVNAAVQERRAKNKRFLGLKMLAKTSHLQPARRKEKTGREAGIRPHIKAACNELRVKAILALQAFRLAYQAARRRWVNGERDVVFPAGTYQLRILHGVCVAACT